VCGDCRGQVECAVCHGERRVAKRRALRRARLSELGRRTAVVALVAASGVTGMSAALLPDGGLAMASFAAAEVAPPRVRFDPALVGVDRPLTLPMAMGWGEPIHFRCFPAGDGVTCCVVSSR
jgi:mono/diheme cytochrome c family protein